MSRTASAETRFAAAMTVAGRSSTAPARPAAVVTPLRPGELHLGDLDGGQPCGISLKKLVEGRLLIQGASGAGKSWTLRRLLEQSAGLIQQILIDPEGEFRSLAEEVEMTVIDATKFDAASIATIATRVREHQISVLLDLSELDREEQMKMFAPFVAALVEAPKSHWFPCMVAVDEAHLFAPFGGQSSEPSSVRKAAIGALVDLMSRGRKRGLCGAIATQRLARLSKSVVSEVHNFLIGTNTLDLDIRRAAETIGWDARRAFDRLPLFQPGGFVAVGPAFSQASVSLRVGPVSTLHSGAAPELKRMQSVEPAKAKKLLDLDGLQEAAELDARTLEDHALTPGLKAVRAFIRDQHFPLAGQIFAALIELSPSGAQLSDLPSHFEVSKDAICGAIALLDLQGVLEIDGGAVRLCKWMRP